MGTPLLPSIQNRIYEIRGHRLMLDFDLAELYEIETKRLKEAVKRNRKKFPADFMITLTQHEFSGLRSQFATSKRGGTRYPPFAFTEHGVTMLASVLNSGRAIEMNIAIIRAFVALRKLVIQDHEILNQLIELRDRIGEHDIQLKQIYEALENLLDKVSIADKFNDRVRIGFKK
jgi:phage regulator Rha-like protein